MTETQISLSDADQLEEAIANIKSDFAGRIINHSDGKDWDLLEILSGCAEYFIRYYEAALTLLRKNHLTPDDISWLQKVFQDLLDPDLYNIEKYNTPERKVLSRVIEQALWNPSWFDRLSKNIVVFLLWIAIEAEQEKINYATKKLPKTSEAVGNIVAEYE